MSACTLLRAALTLLAISHVLAADTALDCKTPVTIGNLEYDLSSLAGEQSVSQERALPPSTMIDSVRFNLCADIATQDKIPSEDQCPHETRACLTTSNKKGSESERIVSVVQLADSKDLNPKFVSKSSPQGLEITLHGATYLDKSQSFKLTLLCNTGSTSSPSFRWYDGSILAVDWETPAGCSHSRSDTPPKDGDKDDTAKPPEQVGSGVGYFFLVIFLAFAAYFGLGAYYNYSTYGARGWDLVPHRDFWREVPYMLQDVVSHLCSSVRPRTTSRGGYVSV